MERKFTIDNILKIEEYNQAHLKQFYDRIENKDSKSDYLNQLESIDYKLLNKLYCNYSISSTELLNNSDKPQRNISPIESNFSKNDFSKDKTDKLVNLGLQRVYEGKVALLILAGGQGSRLGFDKAKGMYNIKMPSNKSLFEYLCNRFLSIQKLSKKLIIPNDQMLFSPSLLLIMTSEENHKETINFFKEHNYFNINSDDIIFFPQDTIPALDLNGKIISKSKEEIFQAPNGNGGCFIAMKKHKVIETCLQRKVEFLHVLSIDNPLSKPLDPFYIGVTLTEGKAKEFQMAAKVVPKRDPSEAVGVFLNVDGKPVMMDYGDMPKELTMLRKSNGDLIYRGGNILNYLISVKLLNDVLLDESKYEELINEFHISKKNIPCVKIENGSIVDTVTSGIKFELFFNSIFKFAEENGLLLLEVNREEEFAPVKNSEDSNNDNPRTCRQMMTNLFTKWYESSGGLISKNSDSDYLLETSYLLSYDGENIIPGETVPKELKFNSNNNNRISLL